GTTHCARGQGRPLCGVARARGRRGGLAQRRLAGSRSGMVPEAIGPLDFMSGVTHAGAGYYRPPLRGRVVEEERKPARALREGLEAESYEVTVASTGEEGFFLANHDAFDLVVLDLMLPGRGGLEVLTTLRKRGLQTPVLILTAKDTVDDRVQGL